MKGARMKKTKCVCDGVPVTGHGGHGGGAGPGSVVRTHRGSVSGSGRTGSGSSASNGVGPGICWLR